jgi:hypothetical protein
MKLWHWLALGGVGYFLLKDNLSPKVFTLKPFQRYRLIGKDVNTSVPREMIYIPAIGLGQTETIIAGQTIKIDPIGNFSLIVTNVETNGTLFG